MTDTTEQERKAFFKTKTLRQYPEDLERVFRIMTIGRGVGAFKVVGTGSSKITPYFGDIDISNKVRYPLDRFQSARMFEMDIKRIVREVLTTENLYFSDFKCGETGGEGIHWTARQVLLGRHRDTSLLDAIQQRDHVIKLDCFTEHNNRLIEITTFFILYYDTDKTLNTPKDSSKETLKRSLMKDVMHYTTEEKNYFKAVKRLYSLLKLTGKATDRQVEFIEDILSGNASLLSQTLSIIEGIIHILETPHLREEVPLESILDSLDTIKFNINSVAQIVPHTDSISSDIHTIKGEIKDKTYKENDFVVSQLHELEKDLKARLSDYTKEQLKENHIDLQQPVRGGGVEDMIRNRMMDALKEERDRLLETKARKQEKGLTEIDNIVGDESGARGEVQRHWINTLNEIRKETAQRLGIPEDRFEPKVDGIPWSQIMNADGMNTYIRKKTGISVPNITTQQIGEFVEKSLRNFEKNMSLTDPPANPANAYHPEVSLSKNSKPLKGKVGKQGRPARPPAPPAQPQPAPAPAPAPVIVPAVPVPQGVHPPPPPPSMGHLPSPPATQWYSPQTLYAPALVKTPTSTSSTTSSSGITFSPRTPHAPTSSSGNTPPGISPSSLFVSSLRTQVAKSQAQDPSTAMTPTPPPGTPTPRRVRVSPPTQSSPPRTGTPRRSARIAQQSRARGTTTTQATSPTQRIARATTPPPPRTTQRQQDIEDLRASILPAGSRRSRKPTQKAQGNI